jgi:8-oxo-dGTP diphosphatase
MCGRVNPRRVLDGREGGRLRVVQAAGAVVQDTGGRVLLVRRATEPHSGTWSLPGGRVEPGETLAEAAAREVREETGLDVVVGRRLWTVTVPGPSGTTYEVHDFIAQPLGGELAAGDDASAVRWFTTAELERLTLTDDLLGHLRRSGVL